MGSDRDQWLDRLVLSAHEISGRPEVALAVNEAILAAQTELEGRQIDRDEGRRPLATLGADLELQVESLAAEAESQQFAWRGAAAGADSKRLDVRRRFEAGRELGHRHVDEQQLTVDEDVRRTLAPGGEATGALEEHHERSADLNRRLADSAVDRARKLRRAGRRWRRVRYLRRGLRVLIGFGVFGLVAGAVTDTVRRWWWLFGAVSFALWLAGEVVGGALQHRLVETYRRHLLGDAQLRDIERLRIEVAYNRIVAAAIKQKH